MMILGLSSYTFGWTIGVPGKTPPVRMKEIELINKTVQAGLSCLQIGDNLPLHTLTAERFDALQLRVAQEGLRLETVLLREVNNTFSDATHKISKRAKPLLFRDNWQKIFEMDDIREQVKDIIRK